MENSSITGKFLTIIAISSRRIGQIMGGIDEISLQIDLSAQNTKVEADRTVGAERGYAAVASGARVLAKRSTAASHALMQEADELARLVAQFKVGAQLATAARPAPTRRPSPTTRKAMKAVDYGGAVLNPPSAPAKDGREEF